MSFLLASCAHTFMRGTVAKKINSKKPLFYNQILKGLNLIVLDTSVQGKISGEICEEQFKFLNKNLSQNKTSESRIYRYTYSGIKGD